MPASTTVHADGVEAPVALGVNRVVLRGVIPSDPTVRELHDGGVLLAFDVTTRGPDRRATTSPVVWFDPPEAAASTLAAAAEVVVVGTVRRRFFVAGGATQSRTEVVATTVLPAARRAAIRKAVASVLSELGERLG
jgi:single-strand DNA-binding protein